jgi:hypothetical protein
MTDTELYMYTLYKITCFSIVAVEKKRERERERERERRKEENYSITGEKWRYENGAIVARNSLSLSTPSNNSIPLLRLRYRRRECTSAYNARIDAGTSMLYGAKRICTIYRCVGHLPRMPLSISVPTAACCSPIYALGRVSQIYSHD